MEAPTIGIAGAGSIGGYLGTMLAQKGLTVSFLGRDAFVEAASAHGLTATNFDGRIAHVPAAEVTASSDPEILAGADLVLVTVKSADTAAMAETLGGVIAPQATIVSLQNGVGNGRTLSTELPGQPVVRGVVPYNVLSLGRGQYRRATGGNITLERDPNNVANVLRRAGTVDVTNDIEGVLWGKLLVNLNNALNALSGLPLRDQLSDRRWRAILAQMQGEALAAMRQHRIKPKGAFALPPRLMPTMMRLPNALFSLAAAKVINIDPAARSSMWEDLEKGRRTEIDALQGEVIRLAEAVGSPAPTCTRVAEAIREAEVAGKGSPNLTPEMLSA